VSPRITAAAILSAAALRAAAPAVRSDDGAATARAAADVYAAATRGVVAFNVTTRTQVRGGLYHRDNLENVAYAAVDGKPLVKRILHLVENGRTADADELRRASAKPDGPLSRFGMRLPYLSAAVDAYTFDPPRAEAGGTVIAFHTSVRDEAHGDGTMTVDAERRPVRVIFHPAKLPEHASDAQVTIEFGSNAAGRWDVMRIVREFSGRVGFIRGRVEAVSTYDAYRVYATAESARAALDRE
jgi:hypothetical protein